MPSLRIDAVAIASTDMARTMAFFEALGFAFPALQPDDLHIEAVTEPGQTRLMIDSEDLMTQLLGEAPRRANHSTFALLCDSPAEVDSAAARVEQAGFRIVTPPWDAFWGQRYAIVADHDGNRVDLFAEL